MKSKKVRLTATVNGKPFKLDTKIVDDNTIEILTRGDQQVKVTVRENPKRGKERLMERGFCPRCPFPL